MALMEKDFPSGNQQRLDGFKVPPELSVIWDDFVIWATAKDIDLNQHCINWFTLWNAFLAGFQEATLKRNL